MAQYTGSRKQSDLIGYRYNIRISYILLTLTMLAETTISFDLGLHLPCTFKGIPGPPAVFYALCDHEFYAIEMSRGIKLNLTNTISPDIMLVGNTMVDVTKDNMQLMYLMRDDKTQKIYPQKSTLYTFEPNSTHLGFTTFTDGNETYLLHFHTLTDTTTRLSLYYLDQPVSMPTAAGHDPSLTFVSHADMPGRPVIEWPDACAAKIDDRLNVVVTDGRHALNVKIGEGFKISVNADYRIHQYDDYLLWKTSSIGLFYYKSINSGSVKLISIPSTNDKLSDPVAIPSWTEDLFRDYSNETVYSLHTISSTDYLVSWIPSEKKLFLTIIIPGESKTTEIHMPVPVISNVHSALVEPLSTSLNLHFLVSKEDLLVSYRGDICTAVSSRSDGSQSCRPCLPLQFNPAVGVGEGFGGCVGCEEWIGQGGDVGNLGYRAVCGRMMVGVECGGLEGEQCLTDIRCYWGGELCREFAEGKDEKEWPAWVKKYRNWKSPTGKLNWELTLARKAASEEPRQNEFEINESNRVWELNLLRANNTFQR